MSIPKPKAIALFRIPTSNIASRSSSPTAIAVMPVVTKRKKFKLKYI